MCVFPTDFLRTLSHTFSKSPQKFIPTSLLPENQGLIQKSLHVGFVVIVVFKPSKPTITTFPTLVWLFLNKVDSCFIILTKRLDTFLKNVYTFLKKLTCFLKLVDELCRGRECGVPEKVRDFLGCFWLPRNVVEKIVQSVSWDKKQVVDVVKLFRLFFFSTTT